MAALDELLRLVEDETLLYRDIKTQYSDYSFVKVSVWSSNEEFLFGLLYDLFDGQIFGRDTVVDVLLLVEEDNVSSLEMVFCNFIISGLPKFKDLRISSCLEDIKNSDYLILHHEVDWGPQEKQKSRMDVLKEQFATLRTWGKTISKCLSHKSKVLLVGDCLSFVRFIIGLYCPDFPRHQIHGITRHYERAAACVLANKLKIPMRDIKGIGVFGEDIVESTNSWIEITNEDQENEIYEESAIYYRPEIYEIMEINQKRKGDSMEAVQKPIKTCEVGKSFSKPKKKKVNSIPNHEREIDPPFGIPELFEGAVGHLYKWQEIALHLNWPEDVSTEDLELPEEWATETNMSRLMNRKPPVKNLRWVVGRLDDEKFHSFTLPKKCKAEQSGFSLARGTSDYILFLLGDSAAPKRTSALLCSPGIYNVPVGLFFSFPVILSGKKQFRIVKGYRVSETNYIRINELVKTLKNEYDYIIKLYQDFPPSFDEPEVPPIQTKRFEEEGFEEDFNPFLSVLGDQEHEE